MKIEWIHIKGFRNFIDQKIYLEDQTLVIGPNDVGKTNLIYALRILFDKTLSERDIDLTESDYNVYSEFENIEITVKLTNVIEDCLVTVFREDLDKNTTFIKYLKSKNEEYKIFTASSEELLNESNDREYRYYIKRLNMEYVTTNRSLDKLIKRERNNLLDLSKDKLSEDFRSKDNEVIFEIGENLKDINSKIDNLNYIKNSLEIVNKELSELAIHHEGHSLAFKNANTDPDILLENLQLTFNNEFGSLTLGGDGRNNQIFLATWMSKQKEEASLDKVTFFAIEEPEAHLHPHQQKKLSQYLLNNFSEQVLITTHSPYIATDFKPDKIVKLSIKNNDTVAALGGCSNEIKLTFDDFGYRLNAITSDVFFVNTVILVEGPSEKLFYTALAQELDIDLNRLNISIISVDGIGFKPYVKICIALDIPFILRTDNDIFKKTVNQQSYDYFAGITRVIGLYKDLLSKQKDIYDTDSELVTYWNNNKQFRQWPHNVEMPVTSQEFNKTIISLFEKDGIYLANEDLEGDLIKSSLFSDLSTHYKSDNEELVRAKMSKRKAMNMYSFLKNHHEKLSVLREDSIVKPLKKAAENVTINSGVEPNE